MNTNKTSQTWLILFIFLIIAFAAIFALNIAAFKNCSKPETQISQKDITSASKLSRLSFTSSDIKMMMEDVNDYAKAYNEMRKFSLDNSVFPALQFNPLMPFVSEQGTIIDPKRVQIVLPDIPGLTLPANIEELAFAPVTVLARLIKSRKITSVALTEMYIKRLKKYDPVLKCVITLTEERAMAQAHRADEDIAAGRYRGPLHGIPWGAKDLLATKGIPTTWGTEPYKDRVIDLDATVVQRLEAAGAVLVAKLTMGELAWGDVWFGGKTKNPWNIEDGSSGSSAGPASATSAGLVGFSIGTETWGSIVSPSTECGVTGLRPTYGRVSRYGAMALSWSMDKIGPICRSVEDCALVFDAIYGPDGKDFTLVNRPFHWDPNLDIKTIRVGYVKELFDEKYPEKENDLKTLETLRSMGVMLVPVKTPSFPVENISFILNAEAAAAFDQFTRERKVDKMARQTRDSWPNVFKYGRFIPAVEYIQANRFRTQLILEMNENLKNVDVYIIPSFGGNHLLLTNLSGHPAVVLPNGFDKKGKPTSITFMGNLFQEAKALRLAQVYQETAGFYKQLPKDFMK